MERLFFIFVCLLLAVPCAAEIITVDDDGLADFNNIQAAINDSNDGDIIEIQPGTYTGNGNRDIDFGGRSITVRSIDPNDPDIVTATVIDCNGTEVEPHRGFYFHSGEGENSIINGLTITNGYGQEEQMPWGYPFPVPAGGAFFCTNSGPKIANCIIRDNFAAFGGGIFCEGSGPKLINCTIMGNSAFIGGGMYNYENSHSILTNCTFRCNRSSDNGHGGGMVNSQSDLTLIHCVFTGNRGGAAGGGMANGNSSPVLMNCTFTNNSAPVLWLTGGGGGAIRNGGGSPTFRNCIFSGNSAGGGGGISNESSNPTLANCTFRGNVSWSGNAIINWWGDTNPTVTNCIFWDGGTEIWNMLGANITISYSNIQGGWLGLGNIDADPCFVDPGYWDANGTPDDANDDFWVDGDYHLKSEGWRWDSMRGRWDYDYVTSLCIDAGNPGSPLADEPLSIPDDPNNVYGKNIRINMGAYGGTAEASMPPLDWYSIADLTNDWAVNFNDLAVFVDYWLDIGRCIPSDLNHNRSIDFNDFAIFSRQWSDTPAVGPAITYQIDDCNPETEQGLAVVSQSGQLRFSVTVEGSYIHFEDMMAANCCSDELGLEMTVVDSLITIYETEYTPGGCHCICDYPVAATLGPFEPGIYTLEVYEDWTGFIGSTIVAIE